MIRTLWPALLDRRPGDVHEVESPEGPR